MDQPRPWEKEYDAEQYDPPVRSSRRITPRSPNKLKMIAKIINELTYQEMKELSKLWAVASDKNPGISDKFITLAESILNEASEK